MIKVGVLCTIVVTALVLGGCKEEKQNTSSPSTPSSSAPASASPSGSTSGTPASSPRSPSTGATPSQAEPAAQPAPPGQQPAQSSAATAAAQGDPSSAENRPDMAAQRNDAQAIPNDDIDFSEDETSSSSPNNPAAASAATSQQNGASGENASGNVQNSSTARSSAAGSGSPMTRAERVAQLEGMLEASIAGHDGVLLREREYALSRANQKGSEAELEAAGSGGLPYDEPGQAGSEAAGPAGNRGEGTGAGAGEKGDQTAEVSTSGSSTARGEQKTTGTYPAPAGIPDGSDDDVVARQIREAAENEPDPALREKLWEEYRNYKNL